MSKQIDERVVSMQFDNSRFERNVQTSMSTLDKLKQKLNLSGASKGLESVQTAASKVNMSGLASSVDTVSSRFSALEVMGVTALANITNSAVNAGKRMLSALTIEPISDGFNEYEMTLNAVQTTMAGTGKTAEEVEKELKKLDEYADKTVYSTSDMLNNLPKFTNAGVELESATKAMIGIANATALAGGDAGKASIAFYNLGQAIGTGYLTRMDYNSINNAGIATMEWKNQMVEAAIAQGTLTKVGEDAYKAGNKTLTLQQLFIDGLQEQWATTDVMMKVFGDYGDETTEIGKKSYSAAQDIKTFSMMMDSLKATAGTGWKDTWQLIFGDLEGAKEFWTGLYKVVSGVIEKMADWRNTLLGGALNIGGIWDTITGKLENSPIGKISKVADTVKNASKSLDYFQEVVNKVWRGDYNNRGDNPDRYDLLDKAGYDHRVVQDLVNKGYQYKLTMADVEESHKKFGLTMTKTSEQTKETSKSVSKLTEEQLKNAGLTNEEISLYKALQKEADKLGISIDELVKNMSEKDGRSLLIDSFKNLWSGISGIFKAIGQAWKEIFNPGGVGALSVKLYGLITALNNFSKKLRMTDETSEKLKRTFKGVFAIIDIIATIVGGPIKIALKLLTKILGAFNLNILDVTAYIGDAIVKFHDWLDEVLDFTAVFEKIAPYIKKAADAIRDWVAAAKPLDKISSFFKKVADGFRKWIDGMKEADNVPQYIIQGLVNGLKAGVTAVGKAIANIGKAIIESICNVLGIHSPSKEMAKVGKWTIEGFIQGIQNGASTVWNVLKSFGAKCIEIIKNIDVGAVLAAATSVGTVIAANTIGKALLNFSAPFEALGDFLEDLGRGIKTWLKADALKKKAEAIKDFAIAIGILVAAVYVLTLIEPGDLWGAIGAIAALSVILIGLSFAISKLNGLDKATLNETGLNVQKTASQIIPIAISLLLVASAVKKLAGISTGDLIKGGLAIAGLGAILIGIMAVTKLVAPNIDKTGSTLLKISVAILVLVFTMKQIAKLDVEALTKGLIFMGLFGAFIIGLMGATQLAGPNVNGLGSTILKISVAILLLVFTARIIGSMDAETLVKGGIVIAAFGGIIAGLIAITRIAGGKEIGKIGSTIIGFSAAMLIMAFAVGILGRMELSTLIKGVGAVTIFGALIAGLIYITKYAGNVKGLGTTILSVAIAIGIIAAVAVLLGLVEIEHLVKGIIAVGLLSAMMAGLIMATKNAQNCKGNLIAMIVAIAVLAGAIAALSLIDPKNLAVATAALSAVMGAFALMIKMSSSLKNVEKAMLPLLTMVAVVALLAGILWALSALKVDVALQTTAGLSLLMLSMSASLVILSVVGGLAKDAFIGIGAFATLAVSLFLLVGVLACMDGLSNAMTNAEALTLLVTAMSLMLIPLSLVGLLGTLGLPFIGVGALATLAASLFIVVGLLATMEGIKNAEQNANLLTELMITMTAVLVVLSIVGPLALIGVTALTAMSGLMLALGGIAVVIGALMEKFPALQSFLNTGIPVLVQLAGGIGQMIGAFVGGIMSEIATKLPAIGTCLSEFMNNAKDFITGAKMVDEKVLAGVGILAGAIIALTAADLITGVLSFLQGGSSFADLGTQLSDFMNNAKDFITGTKSIDPEIMTGVKTLAEAILVLTGANLIESITSFLGCESSLANFGSQLGELGTNMKTFVTNLGTFTEDQVTTVNCAGKAIKALADAASTIPNEGGLWAKIVGDNSLATFGSKLPQLGTDLKGFITNLGTFTGDHVTTVDCAGKAIKALAEAANEIPNEGGLWAAIVGDNSLATFGSALPKLGSDLNGFITNLGTFGDDKIATVECAGKAIKTLADVADTIPNEGGLWAKIVGDNSLATFGSKLPGLAKDIAGFVTNLGEFGSGQIATVNSACRAIGYITDLGKLDLGDTSSGIEKLGKKLSGFAKKLADFVSAIGDVGAESIDSAIKKTKDLIDLAKTAAGTNVESLSTFGTSLKKVATEGVKGFVKEFTGESPKEKVTKAATTMLDAFIKSAKGKKGDVEKTFKEVAAAAAKKVATKGIISDFTTAGEDCAEGFANGIKNNKRLATNAGSALGKAALAAAKEALDENSPSKEMYKVGNFAGVGFVNALYDNVSQAYKAGTRVADSAKVGISNAVARIADIVNSDIDAQPTIRPVLDLSDVRAGAGSINALFSGRTLAVDMAGVGAVSATMAGHQNGNNSGEIVSALKALRKDISNMPRDAVNINGITYSGDSEINDAVQTLVRAVKVERRS